MLNIFFNVKILVGEIEGAQKTLLGKEIVYFTPPGIVWPRTVYPLGYTLAWRGIEWPRLFYTPGYSLA